MSVVLSNINLSVLCYSLDVVQLNFMVYKWIRACVVSQYNLVTIGVFLQTITAIYWCWRGGSQVYRAHLYWYIYILIKYICEPTDSSLCTYQIVCYV